MVERNFSDPESMVGATAEEVAAMKPEGWLIRPFPDGRQGFQMLDPGTPAGAIGSISYHFGTPGFRVFTTRPPTPIFILNEALEMPTVGTLARGYSGTVDGSYTATDVSILADAALLLLKSGLIQLWEDSLGADDAVLLKKSPATSALEDRSNWLPSASRAPVSSKPALFLDITKKGRDALRDLDRKPLKLRRR